MFRFLRAKKAEVLDHWYVPVPSFQMPSQDFYAPIEVALKAREVPGLDVERVDFAEGGLLSAKRTYLRLTRERLVFDICAAPFGTAYFFSCRFAEFPAVVPLWMLLVILGAVFMAFFTGLALCAQVFGFMGVVLFPFACLAVLLLAIYAMRNAEGMGIKDLDTALLNVPILGAVYQAWIRRETYYREDTRLMYLETVTAVVKETVEELTAQKGVKLLRYHERSPMMGDLYKPRTVNLGEKRAPAP